MIVNIGKGIELDVNHAALPQVAMDHVIRIGLRNILMDAHASATKEEHGDDFVRVSRAMAEKKLAALLAGEVRVVGTREGDPVRAEALRMATAAIVAAWRVANPTKKKADLDMKLVRERAIALVAKDAKYMTLAKARVDELKSATDIDLGDL